MGEACLNPVIDQTTIQNRLLGVLSLDDFSRLSPHLEPFSFEKEFVFVAVGERIEHVYFLQSGLSSEIAVSPDRLERTEISSLGREGLTGHPVLLGVEQGCHHSFAQVEGHAYRIRREALMEAMEASSSLRRLLLAFLHTLMVQIAQTALSNSRYTIEQRLARWVLMGHDRLGDTLLLTHDFFAIMLGVRRPGVTTALHLLEGDRLIRSDRAKVTVLDREGLKQRAAGSYGLPEAEYERVIGVRITAGRP